MSLQFQFDVVDLQTETKIDKQGIGCYVQVGKRLLDVLVLSDLEQKLKIQSSNVNETVQIIVKYLGDDDQKLGSVSFLFSDLVNAKKGKAWVTIFDNLNDDLYDGDFSEDDDEIPRILIEFSQIEAQKKAPAPAKEAAKPKHNLKSPTSVNRPSTAGQPVQSRVSQPKRQAEPPKKNIDLSGPGKKGAAAKAAPVDALTRLEEEKQKYNPDAHLESLSETLANKLDDLQQEQADHHQDEDLVTGNLQELDAHHKDLQDTHKQDEEETKKAGKNLQAHTDEVTQLKNEDNDKKAKLRELAQKIELELRQTRQQLSEADLLNKNLKSKVNQSENLKEQGLLPESQKLRQDNRNLRDQIHKTDISLNDERSGKDQALKGHTDESNYYSRDLGSWHRQLEDVENQRNRIEDDHQKEDVENKKEKNDFLTLTKSKEDGENDIFLMNSELLGIQVNQKKTTTRYDQYLKDHEALVKEYSDENEKLKNELNNSNQELNQLQVLADQQTRDKDYVNGDIEKIRSQDFPGQIQKLIKDLNDKEKARAQSQTKLENLQETWKAKLALFANPADAQLREQENKDHVDKLKKQLNDLNDTNKNIRDTEEEMDSLKKKLDTDKARDGLDEEYQKMLDDLADKLAKYQQQRDQGKENLKDLLGKLNGRQVDEDALRKLKEELDKVNKQIAEENKAIDALKKELDALNKQIAQLEQDILNADAKIGELQEKIADLEALIAQRQQDLADREARERELKKLLSKPPPKAAFKPKKGDLIDQMLAEYITGCRVPIKKLYEGYYLFGTKKIYAKIMNGKLVIRVGGGYMIIEEFIATYEDPELVKLENYEKQGITFEDLWLKEMEKTPGSKQEVARRNSQISPNFKGVSPRHSTKQ